MSSRVSGQLLVYRSSRGLGAVAAAALDPRRLAGWVRAGRAGALEARRLLVAAREEHARTLRTALDKLRSEEPTLAPVEGPLSDETLISSPAPEAPLFSPFDEPLLNNEVRELVPDALLSESLESEAFILLAAFSQSLEAEGFLLERLDAGSEGLCVSGRRGTQIATIQLSSERELCLDVGVPGFATTAECEATRDGLLRRLGDVGIGLDERPLPPGSGLTPSERRLAGDVEHAVRRSLPGYEIRSIVEGDELQVIGLPPREAERSSS